MEEGYRADGLHHHRFLQQERPICAILFAARMVLEDRYRD